MTDVNMVESEPYLSEAEGTKTPTIESKPSSTSERRRRLVRAGIDSKVLAVLDYEFTYGQRKCIFLDALGHEFLNAETGQPVQTVVWSLRTAMEKLPDLDLDQKKVLYGILGWKFECKACRNIKFPCEFERTVFGMADVRGSRYSLMTGDACVACERKARERKVSAPQARA